MVRHACNPSMKAEQEAAESQASLCYIVHYKVDHILCIQVHAGDFHIWVAVDRQVCAPASTTLHVQGAWRVQGCGV